jgi:outer membrane cobalamin receptor
MIRKVVAFVFVAVFSAAPLFGQSTVTVSGTINDTSGGVLPGALVEAIVSERTIASAATGQDGRYQLSIPSGVPFQLRVRLQGFADQLAEFAGSSASQSRDIAMAVGRVSDTVVVTASRTSETRLSVMQSVTVMTAGEIRALGSTSLADVVRFVPGVAVEGTGREGALTSLFSRGGESDYNLVLIDGVRVNQNGGLFDFGRIGAGEIERVEVVRGAQSSLWGSDAMGSVVQVFTRRAGAADSPRVTGSVEGGSLNTWRGDARLTGGAFGRMDYQGGGSHRRSDGAFADLLLEDDSFEQSTFDGGLGATLGARATVRTGLRYSDGQGRNVGQITYGARDTGGSYDTNELSWHADLSHSVGGRYTGLASLNYFRLNSTSGDTIEDAPFGTFAILEGTPNALFPDGMRLVRLITQAEFNAFAAAGATPAPGQFIASTQSFDFPFTSRTQLRRPAVRYQGDFTWGGGQRLTAGYDWERETNPLVPGFSLNNSGVFVQQQFDIIERWVVTVGARSDSKESYDTFFSPKLSAGGFILPAGRGAISSLKVFGNIGKGIKSPSFLERFGASFADPSPDLKVERARTADAGVEATFADQRVRGTVTYFHNDYTDQIAFRSGVVGDRIPEYINIDGSQANGWELEVALQRPAAGFTAGASYSLVDTEVVTNLSTSHQFQPGQPLLRRPRHSGTVRASYSAGRVTVNFDARIVGDRHDNSFLFLRTVANAARPAFSTDITVNPGYAVAGLGLDFRASGGATMFVRSNNIADTEYDSALGYPGMPRTVTAGIRFDLGRR